jgi:hypothetical protein
MSLLHLHSMFVVCSSSSSSSSSSIWHTLCVAMPCYAMRCYAVLSIVRTDVSSVVAVHLCNLLYNRMMLCTNGVRTYSLRMQCQYTVVFYEQSASLASQHHSHSHIYMYIYVY